MGKKEHKNDAKSEERKSMYKSKQAKKKTGRKNRQWNKRIGKEFTDGTLGEEHFDFFEDWYRHISILCYTIVNC